MDLSWTAPAFTGGAPITGYRVESSPNGTDPWTEVFTTTGDGTNDTDDGTDANGPVFSAGNWPHYRVAAVNRVGTGPFSESRYAGGDPLVNRYDANGNGTTEPDIQAEAHGADPSRRHCRSRRPPSETTFRGSPEGRVRVGGTVHTGVRHHAG